MVSVRWSVGAQEMFERLDPDAQRRILLKVSWLEENFTRTPHKKLHQELAGFCKLRVGDYRVMYAMRNENILIEAVGHRSNFYE